MMNLNSQAGNKVRFDGVDGWVPGQKYALGFIEPGDLLTVDMIDIGSSSSSVMFLEHPGLWFNTVMFENVYTVEELESELEDINKDLNTLKARQARLIEELKKNGAGAEIIKKYSFFHAIKMLQNSHGITLEEAYNILK